MKPVTIFVVILILLIVLSFFIIMKKVQKGEAGTTESDKELAKKLCIEKCNHEKNLGRNLSAGPCLDNKIIQDWVCDVAHFPRITEDNKKENQCPEYGITAKHFVEVNEECKFIRAI